jgi:hypothetical protein
MILIQSTPASINWRVFAFAERRPGDVHRRPGNVSARDALLDCDDRLQRRREIANGCDTSHEHLLGRRGDDDALELRRVRIEPVARIRMARVHQMNVEIPQPREHREPFGRNGLVVSGNRERIDRSDLLDALAADQDDAVTKRRIACAVDQRAADHRERPAQRRTLRRALLSRHRHRNAGDDDDRQASGSHDPQRLDDAGHFDTGGSGRLY